MYTNLNAPNQPIDQAALDRMFDLEKELALVRIENIFYLFNLYKWIQCKKMLFEDYIDNRSEKKSNIFKLYFGHIE